MDSIGRNADARTIVAVVHGRDLPMRDWFFDLLESAGLKPLQWDEAVGLTGTAAPFNMQAVNALVDKVQAVIVLLTPDDLAVLHPDLIQADAREFRYQGQPRQNVLIETGMALSRRPDSTIIVQIGAIREASDLSGINVIRLDGSPRAFSSLINRLRAVGCEIEANGPTVEDVAELFHAVRSRENEPVYSYRGLSIFEAARRTGLMDIENRSDSGDLALPPRQFYARAQDEVVISAVSAFSTFHQHDRDIYELLSRGVAVRILILDPSSKDIQRVNEREGRRVDDDIRSVIGLVKNSNLGRRSDFQLKVLPFLAPFTAVMVDGNVDGNGGSEQLANQGEIRVQPGAYYGTQHNGPVLHFRNIERGSPFEFFASDLRRQWRSAVAAPQ